jgi:hypothetical protein
MDQPWIASRRHQAEILSLITIIWVLTTNSTTTLQFDEDLSTSFEKYVRLVALTTKASLTGSTNTGSQDDIISLLCSYQHNEASNTVCAKRRNTARILSKKQEPQPPQVRARPDLNQ